MEKVFAIYNRVSSAEQASSREGSLVSQRQRCLEYLKYANGEDSKFVVFVDEGSGKDTNRPSFKQMVEGISSGKIHSVICTELSRVSRSVIDFHKFIDLCNRNNVSFISLREKFDTSTSQGKLMLSILASFAQFEREQISERTSANMRARARRGLYNGGYIYGYIPRPGQKGYLDPDPHEAAIVNLIFEKYLEIGSYCLVANLLNEMGYRTREYVSRNGKKKPACLWNGNSVIQVLRNPMYIGKRKVDDKIINGVWEPIVLESTWMDVQNLLARNYRSRGNTMAQVQHTYLFGGLLCCPYCDGSILESGAGIGSGGKYFYYRHPASKRKDKECPNRLSYPAQKLEDFLASKLIAVLDDEKVIEMVCREISALAIEEEKKLESQLASVKAQISGVDGEVGMILQTASYLQEMDIRELITPRISKLSERIQSLKASKREIEGNLYHVKSKIFRPNDIRNTFRVLAKDFWRMNVKEKRKLIDMMVEKVEVHPDQFVVWMRESSDVTLDGSPIKVSGRTFPITIPA